MVPSKAHAEEAYLILHLADVLLTADVRSNQLSFEKKKKYIQ